MSNDRYSMSFTTGSLFHRESVELAALYLDLGDWNSVRDKVVAVFLLQTRTLNTLKRVCREIISRLRTLSPGELEFLVEGSHQEQAYLLWLAVCRRYRFIADFAVEVLRERYITLKSDLTHEDFDSFFNRKSEWHLELDEITPAQSPRFSPTDTPALTGLMVNLASQAPEDPQQMIKDARKFKRQYPDEKREDDEKKRREQRQG